MLLKTVKGTAVKLFLVVHKSRKGWLGQAPTREVFLCGRLERTLESEGKKRTHYKLHSGKEDSTSLGYEERHEIQSPNPEAYGVNYSGKTKGYNSNC